MTDQRAQPSISALFSRSLPLCHCVLCVSLRPCTLSPSLPLSFDDVRAILFIVNLAGFNQVLFEDIAKNRMFEELELFEQIVNNQLFASVPIFLFLNKKDLFEQMITEIDMKKTFAEYEGGKAMDPALSYVMVRRHTRRKRAWGRMRQDCCCR